MVTAINRCTPIHHSNKPTCKVGRYLDSFFEYRGRSYKIISIQNNQIQVSRDDHALSSSQIAWRVFLTATIVVLLIAAIYKIGRLIQLSKYNISLYEAGNENLNIIEDNNSSKKKRGPETIWTTSTLWTTSTVFPQKIEDKKSNASTEILSSVDADSHSHHTVGNASSSSITLDVGSIMDFSSMRVFDANAFKGPADYDKFQELLKIWKKLDLILLPSLHQMDDAFLRCLAAHASQNIALACIICKTFDERFDEINPGELDEIINGIGDSEESNFAGSRILVKQFAVFLQAWIYYKGYISDVYPILKMSDDKRCELQNLLWKTVIKYDMIGEINDEKSQDALILFMLEQNENPAQLLDLIHCVRVYRNYNRGQYDIIMQNLTDKQLEIIAKGFCIRPENCYHDSILEDDLLQDLLSWLDYHIVCKGFDKSQDITTELQIFEYFRKAKKMVSSLPIKDIFSSDGLSKKCFIVGHESKERLCQYFSRYEMLQLSKHGKIEQAFSVFKEFKNRFDQLPPTEKFPSEASTYINLKQQYETFLASWLANNGSKWEMSSGQRQELQELTWRIFQEHNCLVKEEFKTAFFSFMLERSENPGHLQDLCAWIFAVPHAKTSAGMDYIKIFMQDATDKQLEIIAKEYVDLDLLDSKRRLIDFVFLMDYCIVNAEKQGIAKPKIFEYFKKVKRILPSFEVSNIFRPKGQFQDSLAVSLKNIFPKKLHDYLCEYELC